MRTASAGLTTDLASSAQRPGLLVEILFSSPLRFCSRGEVQWAGNTWLDRDIRISGLAVDSSRSSQEGSLTLGNTDYAVSTSVLLHGIADRKISIWELRGESPATDDPVLLFSGVGDSCAIEPDGGMITINLVMQNARTLFSPRLFINAASGFSIVPPEGTLIPFNGETFQLNRARD